MEIKYILAKVLERDREGKQLNVPWATSSLSASIIKAYYG
jgi:hypothetical protein